MGFELTISAGERPQTYALDRAATGTDVINNIIIVKSRRVRCVENRVLIAVMINVKVIIFVNIRRSNYILTYLLTYSMVQSPS